MKKIIKSLAGIRICLASFLLVSCPQPQLKKGYEGTKLVVPQWPENIEHVQLSFENSTWSLNCYQANVCEATEYFTGNAILTIYYSRIDNSERDQYFGYGIRSNAENQFKVFVNGEEVENEFPQATYHSNKEDTDLELNANIDHFRATFNVTNVQNVEVTFENAPEKILNKDIRLADETTYAYIDITDLTERFKYVSISENVSNTWYDFEKLARGGPYYFSRYTQNFYIDLSVVDNYYISSTDLNFNIDSENIPAEISASQNSNEINCNLHITFTSSSPDKAPAGSVIKVTGGTITPYDVSNYANKTLEFAEACQNENFDEVNQAELELVDNGSKTFNLTVNNKEYTGTWKAKREIDGEDTILIELSSETGVGEDFKLKTIQLKYYETGYNNTSGPCWHFESTLMYYAEDENKKNYRCSFVMTEKK